MRAPPRQFVNAFALAAAPLLVTRPASAQLEDFRAALARAGTAVSAIRSDSIQLNVVVAGHLRENTAAIDRHNAVWPDGICHYQREPSECQPWIDEAARLNTEKANIIQEGEALSTQIRDNKQRFALSMSTIRVLRLLNTLREWHDREVMPCTTMAPEPAYRCLYTAWERHP